MDNKLAFRLLITAGLLMIIAGVIFCFIQQWIFAVLLGVGGFGCFVGAFNFKNAKNNHQMDFDNKEKE